MKRPNDIGVALSGGGYRASAFHLGTLNKLNDLGILERVDVLSTISGGSITGAAWCLSDDEYPVFHSKMIRLINRKSIIQRVIVSWQFLLVNTLFLGLLGFGIYLTFTRYAPFSSVVFIAIFLLFFFFQYRILPVSQIIERIYDDIYFKKKTLKDLKKRPVLAMGSSNLQTGRPFTFSGLKMSDSAYDFEKEFAPPVKFDHTNFPVSRAVMASSCVPSFFSPVKIGKEFYINHEDHVSVNPILIDGGVYDNQGIQKITEPKSRFGCNTVIVSDAGGSFSATKKYQNVFKLLLRTIDLFMYRIKTSQMTRHVYNNNTKGPAGSIAYLSLGWKLSNCIPGFINNMINGLIPEATLNLHGLKEEWKREPGNFIDQITEKLESNVRFKDIEKSNLAIHEWELARSVGTNLTKLSMKEITALVVHAENLTEIQVKLYCPGLLNTEKN